MRPVLIRLFISGFLAIPLTAQVLINTVRNPRIVATFEAAPNENSLRCEVFPIKPTLNYGFRFQAGYVVRIPLMLFSGDKNRLTILTRITPKNGKPRYFAQGMNLPPIPDNAPKKDQIIETGGNMLLGEGQYQVDWLLADSSGRTCRKKWVALAELKGANRNIKTAIPAGVITDLSLRGTARGP